MKLADVAKKSTENALNVRDNIVDIDLLVRNEKQITLKNLQVLDPVRRPIQSDRMCIIEVHNQKGSGGTLSDLGFHWGNLPKDTQIFVAFEKMADKKSPILAKPEDLEESGIKIARGKKDLFQKIIEDRYGKTKELDLETIYQLSVAKDRSTIIPSIRITEDLYILAAFNVVLPEYTKGESQFDVFQQIGKRVVGGSTYLLSPSKKHEKE